MISTGWKVLPTHTASGALDNSTEPAEIDTSLTEFAIPCSGMSWCQLSIASTTGSAHNIVVYGTNSTSEDGQQVTGYFNSKLVAVTFATSGLAIPSGVFPSLDSQGSFTCLNSGAIEEFASGNEAGALLLNSYLHMAGQKGMAPDNQADTDETNEYENYYVNDGTVAGTGVSWIAIPCATFDYIQVRFVPAAAAILSPMFCLYS